MTKFKKAPVKRVLESVELHVGYAGRNELEARKALAFCLGLDAFLKTHRGGDLTEDLLLATINEGLEALAVRRVCVSTVLFPLKGTDRFEAHVSISSVTPKQTKAAKKLKPRE